MKTQKALQLLFDRQGGLCSLCAGPMWMIWARGGKVGGPPEMFANIDHDVPRSKGGGNDLENLRASHYACNQAKKDQPISSFPLACYSQEIRWS